MTRREFIYQMVGGAGTILVFPMLTSCMSSHEDTLHNIPYRKPEDWNPINFNRIRGNAGAIPQSYLPDINGPDGEKKHIGKHLPYIPDIDKSLIPNGFIALMWGDPSKGYTPHPNAPPDESNKYRGHWYNRIQIRKATNAWAETAESTYSGWPSVTAADNGIYAVSGGADITADKGIHTVYLAALPPNIRKGDTIRIWAHCLTHGEYIDFIKI